MQVIDVSAGSGFAWIKQAFAMFLARPGSWISLASTWFLVTIGCLFIPAIGPAIMIMIQPALFAGFVLAAREQAEDRPFTVAQLFGGFRFNGRALVTLGSITLLAELLVVFFLDALGFPRTTFTPNGLPDMPALVKSLEGKTWLLFLGFGLMVLIKGVLWFATPLLATHDMRPGHALRWAFYAFIANLLPLVMFGVLMMVIFFIGALTWGLGLLVAFPIYAIAHYTSFQQVFRD